MRSLIINNSIKVAAFILNSAFCVLLLSPSAQANDSKERDAVTLDNVVEQIIREIINDDPDSPLAPAGCNHNPRSAGCTSTNLGGNNNGQCAACCDSGAIFADGKNRTAAQNCKKCCEQFTNGAVKDACERGCDSTDPDSPPKEFPGDVTPIHP